MTGVLSDIELDKAAGYRRAADQIRSVTASWLLRTTTAAQLAVPPHEVPIDRWCGRCGKHHGKPRINSKGTELQVSVSHSGNRVAVALSMAGEVGVDVEEIQDSGDLTLCALARSERLALLRLPKHQRQEGVTRMWVRKEAVLKATGHGLRIEPDQIEVSGPQEDPVLLGWPLSGSPDSVQLHTLDAGRGYAAALAVLGARYPVKVFESKVPGLGWEGFTTPQPIAV